MKNAIHIAAECPVCSQSVTLPNHDCCSNCGWQFTLFSGQPSDFQLEQLKHRQDLKKQYYNSFSALETAEQACRQKIKDIEGLHQIQRENYEQRLPNFVELAQQLANIKLLGEPVDTTELERQVVELQRQIDLLHDRMQPGHHPIISPKVTFTCKYDQATNQLEIEVEEVLDRFARISIDLVFAVAFFHKPGITFHDADLIVATEAKRVEVFSIGEQINFKLKYQVPKDLVNKNHQQIIHLIFDSLSEYIIK